MKICPVCLKAKKDEEFYQRGYRAGATSANCVDCEKAYRKRHYKENKAKYLAKAKRNDSRYRERKILWLIEYFKSNPCVDCGEKDPLVLQFDHVRGRKSFNIANMARGASIEAMEKEIKKCDVRCANCHTRRTAKQGNWLILKFLHP